MNRAIPAAVLALALCAAAPAAADAAFIASPSRNIVCMVNSAAADCIIYSRAQQAKVTRSGRVTVTQQRADVGDQPLRILPYGSSYSAGPITCTSLSSGMRCRHRPSGNGFLMARAGVRVF